MAMTRLQRGRGGWNRGAMWWRTVVLVVACVALTSASGCSSKKKGPGEGELPPTNVGNQGGEGNIGSGEINANPDTGPLHDIHFGYNDYTIQPQDGSVLKSNAEYLNKNRNTRVQIEGHCDERGSEDYNIALGAKRAQAAKDYLVTLGIAGSRMSTISYGKELPLCQ